MTWNTDLFWILLGVSGQLIFAMRFLWQWVVSERRRESVIPLGFWYLSIAGALILLLYCLFRDPVLVPGQLCGLVIYTRNLVLIYGKRRSGAGQLTGSVTLPQHDPPGRMAA